MHLTPSPGDSSRSQLTRAILGAVAALALLVTYVAMTRVQSEISSLRMELASLQAERESVVAHRAADAGADTEAGDAPGEAFVDEMGLVTPLARASPPNLPSTPPPAAAAAAGKGKGESQLEKGGYGNDPKLDSKAVGGFTLNDTQGQSTMLYEYLVKVINVRSLLDVGCGRGISTRWFLDHGVDVLCVEGSHDALKHTLLPRDRVVLHDFNRGPWWPAKTYDFAWSVEFLEHVSRDHMRNYMTTFKQAGIIFVTSSIWGGYHHVSVVNPGKPYDMDWWWRSRFAAHGMIYSAELTRLFRSVVARGATNEMTGQHLQFTSHVYLNPRVLGLPQHQHLFGGPTCYSDGQFQIPCDGEDELKPPFTPVWQGRGHAPDKEPPEMAVMTKGKEKVRPASLKQDDERR